MNPDPTTPAASSPAAPASREPVVTYDFRGWAAESGKPAAVTRAALLRVKDAKDTDQKTAEEWADLVDSHLNGRI
jgi:hypothetical protein